MPDPLVLEGCRPTPLASYLKALGILRLVAEQKDPEARGCWHADRFHLRTALDRAGLMRFFLEEYKPTPIIAPWNGRAGFLEGESDDEAESSRAGAQLVRAYVATKAQRFDDLKRAADTFASLPTIKELDGTRAAIKAIDKRAKSEKRKLSDNERKKKAELEKRAKLVKDALRDDLRAQSRRISLPGSMPACGLPMTTPTRRCSLPEAPTAAATMAWLSEALCRISSRLRTVDHGGRKPNPGGVRRFWASPPRCQAGAHSAICSRGLGATTQQRDMRARIL
jgi:hypothetical protein